MAKIDDIKNLMSRVCKDYKEAQNKVILNEGIDIDDENHTISFNPNHEDNVDTSVENNPTLELRNINAPNGIVMEIPTYSIFKRKSGTSDKDGNPLLYAYKNEQGWKFKTRKDRNAIDRQFDLIARKFMSMYKGGKITVIIPSENLLNMDIANRMKAINKDLIIYTDWITKMPTEEVLKACLQPNSKFRREYRSDKTFNKAINDLKGYLNVMNKHHNGTFARHFVKDIHMRDVITRTMEINCDNPSFRNFIAKTINADILIIDDSITQGHSLTEACQLLIENVPVNSITILTLMSRLY